MLLLKFINNGGFAKDPLILGGMKCRMTFSSSNGSSVNFYPKYHVKYLNNLSSLGFSNFLFLRFLLSLLKFCIFIIELKNSCLVLSTSRSVLSVTFNFIFKLDFLNYVKFGSFAVFEIFILFLK